MRSVDDITAPELLDGLPSRAHEVYAPFVRDIPDRPAFVEGGVRGVTGSSRKLSTLRRRIFPIWGSGPAIA
jgi:hypothetical protein